MNRAVMPNKKKLPAWTLAAPLAVAALAVAGYVALSPGGQPVSAGMAFVPVSARDLDVTVAKDGELQAVNNIDVISEVEGSTTIQTIVREGSSVRKGDVIVVLDSANIRQRIDDVTLEVQRAEADVVNSREMLEIQKSQNQTNLEAAQVQLENSRIDLQKYLEGDYPQQLAALTAALQMARINLANREQDFRQVQELAASGFLTPTDVKAREVDLIRARNDLADAENKLRNLETFDRQKQTVSLRTNLVQAEQRLVRVQRENAANETQRETDLAAKEQALSLKKRTLEKLHSQLEATTIEAPEDGMVVYASSGDRNAQQQIQEGAQVRERQMLLRLPDTSHMKAVVRIQEAQVTRLREGQRALINVSGVPKQLTGTVTKISVLADSGGRWWSPDVKEYPVDIELDETPQGVKPGVGATAEIFVARLDNVLTVPISTIYSSGPRTFVFMKPAGDESPTPREIKLGLSSTTHIEVREGLKAGEEVLVLQAGQGRELLEKAGIRDESATTRGSRGPGEGRRRGGEAGAPPSENASPGGAAERGGERGNGERRGRGPQSAAPTSKPAVTGVDPAK